MTYELWYQGRRVTAGYSEDAMRAYILHMGYERFIVYNHIGYDKTEAFS